MSNKITSQVLVGPRTVGNTQCRVPNTVLPLFIAQNVFSAGHLSKILVKVSTNVSLKWEITSFEV